MRDVDLEYYEGLLREIGEIVRTPTNETRHRSAQVHFQSDFDAIRKIVATGLRRPGGVAQAALGSCTQAELDTWEKHLDSKDAQLLLMWVDRALKAEAALALPSTHQRETYCALCDREHQLHEDAQGFHHVIKGERVACPVPPAERLTEAEGRK